MNSDILAMATVPVQTFGVVYDPKKALQIGTVFVDLDLPFFEGGVPHA
ncbi:MAG: spore coat associated protein CotJA [Clostridia bacterium]|nr:spore coat associated protein CotJA [Lachnospiraceae bacterium]NCC01659.1 spore coat associated protein CotJA [Clostridia bacterium]NCD03556.1 spore coat associated protein CotJA [Clostridia bacterium]